MGANEHMLKNGWIRILKAVLKRVPLLLVLTSTYYGVQGRLALAGILFIAAGILLSFWRFPYFIFFILGGLAILLSAYKYYILVLIVAPVVLAITVLDTILSIRLLASGKLRTLDKSKGESPLECMRENEITFKVWDKLKPK
jgi:hypothetical protein